MSTFVVVLHVFICVLLVISVLVQAGKDGGMGAMAGGSSQTVFGSSGGANFIARFTAVVAFIFMVTSISLTLMRGRTTTRKSVFDNAATTQSQPVQPTAAPAAAPATPATAPSAPAAAH